MDKAFGPRQQMMFQQWQSFLLGDLHAGRMFPCCKSCAFAEQQQLPPAAHNNINTVQLSLKLILKSFQLTMSLHCLDEK